MHSIQSTVFNRARPSPESLRPAMKRAARKSMTRYASSLSVILAVAVTPALAYSTRNAQYVTSSKNKAVLNYIVCLERSVARTGHANIPAALAKAERACAKEQRRLPRSTSEPNAEDIRMMIMECGFKRGDSDAC